MDFVLVSDGMEFASSGTVRAGGHSVREFSPLREEGVPARLPPLSEPGARREQRESPGAAPTPVCAPVAAGGGEHRTPSQAPQQKGKRQRGREVPWAGRSRSAPAGSGSARGSPSGPVPPVSRGLRVAIRGITFRSVSCSREGSGDPGHRQRESAEGWSRPGGGSGTGCCLRAPDPWERQHFGLFLGVEFGHSQRVCVCQELLSELLPGSAALTPTERLQLQVESLRTAIMPLKQPEKSPLPSQIPGLSDLSRAPHEVPLSGYHRKWTKETDSAYVRLAKQGGQPDLLKHYTTEVMKPSPAACAAPDWYSHCANPTRSEKPRSCGFSLPDYMVHREFKADDHHENSYEARRGPFDFDTKSIWQWDAEDKENAEKKKVKLPPITLKYPSRMPTVSANKEFSGANKLSFPPMPAQRKSEAVNFSKLISNGYGTDWFQQSTGWEKKTEETSENSEHSEDSERSESPPASNELKPPRQGCNK